MSEPVCICYQEPDKDYSVPCPLHGGREAANERLRAALQHIHDYPRGWKTHGPSVREFIRDTLDQEEQP